MCAGAGWYRGASQEKRIGSRKLGEVISRPAGVRPVCLNEGAGGAVLRLNPPRPLSVPGADVTSAPRVWGGSSASAREADGSRI